MILCDLSQADTKIVSDYVSLEPELNLFISGDVESFGIDGRHVRVKGLFDVADALSGVLLRYMDRNYVFYSRREKIPGELIADSILADNPALKGVCLNGKASLIRQIAPFLPSLKEEVTMMARCDKARPLSRPAPSEAFVRPLKEADFHEYFSLIGTISEFSRSQKNEEKERNDWIANLKRGSVAYGVFVEGGLLALASSTADTADSAMLVGVCTKEGFRRRGYASLAVSALLEDRFMKGDRFVCLFYDNPLAGRIYHKFGFVDVAPFTMLH